ncbi:MAG: HAD family phosphatase [Erysipelotrichaceae bacterium]|nr:HAD family phosphatase [Erysipelotrichaceae bacterium]
MIKALIFDIDDTLIPRGQPLVTESALQAALDCKKKGYKIIVATGRGYYLMQPDIKERFPADYLITVNGCCINEAGGRVIRTYPMTMQDTEQLISECLEKDYTFGFKFDDSFQVYNHYEDFVSRYCSPGITADMIDDNSNSRDYHLVHGLPLSGFVYSPECAAMDLKDDHPGMRFVYAVRKAGSIECFDLNSNKGRSIEELMQMLGCTLDECMAFGDSHNDIDMLKMCGIGIAMGNAHEDVKAIADYVTEGMNDDGILKALQHFGLL